MVKIVRCPVGARNYFTPHELSGWPEGMPQVISPRRRSRRELRQAQEAKYNEYIDSLSRPPVSALSSIGVVAE